MDFIEFYLIFTEFLPRSPLRAFFLSHRVLPGLICSFLVTPFDTFHRFSSVSTLEIAINEGFSCSKRGTEKNNVIVITHGRPRTAKERSVFCDDWLAELFLHFFMFLLPSFTWFLFDCQRNDRAIQI